ncbi:MAG: alpha/beta hydrolase [Burkholderiales bacterium]
MDFMAWSSSLGTPIEGCSSLRRHASVPRRCRSGARRSAHLLRCRQHLLKVTVRPFDRLGALHNVMAGDLPMPTAKALAAVEKPIAAQAFTDADSHAAWHDKPTWYLVTEADYALPPRVQRLIAQQLGARTVTIQSSHLSLVSHPRQVVELIDRAASTSRR